MCHISFESCHFCVGCALVYSKQSSAHTRTHTHISHHHKALLCYWSAVFTAAAVIAFSPCSPFLCPLLFDTTHMCLKHSPIVSHLEQHIGCDTFYHDCPSANRRSHPSWKVYPSVLGFYSTWQDHVFFVRPYTVLYGVECISAWYRERARETKNLCTAFVRPLYGIGC